MQEVAVFPIQHKLITLDVDAIANMSVANTSYNGLNNYFMIDMMASLCDEFGITLVEKAEEDCIHFRLDETVMKEDELKELLDTYIYHQKQQQYAELKKRTKENVKRAIQNGSGASHLIQAYQNNYQEEDVKQMADAKRDELVKSHLKAFALIRSDEDAIQMISTLQTQQCRRMTVLCNNNYFLPNTGAHTYMTQNEIIKRINNVQDAFKSYHTAVAYVSDLLLDLRNAIYSYVSAYVRLRSYSTEYRISKLVRTNEHIAVEKKMRTENQLKHKNNCIFLLEHICNIASCVPSMRAHVNSWLSELLVQKEYEQFQSEVWMQYAILNDPNRVQSVLEYLTGYRSEYTLQMIKNCVNKTLLNIKRIQFRKKIVELMDKQVEVEVPDMIGHIFHAPNTICTEECAKHIASAFLQNELDLKEDMLIKFIQSMVSHESATVNKPLPNKELQVESSNVAKMFKYCRK